MPKKTRLPQQIVTHLRRNPTASRSDLADALGVSYQAVQKHLRRMEEEGTVLPAFLVTDRWDAQRHEFWVFIETRFYRGEGRGAMVGPPAGSDPGGDPGGDPGSDSGSDSGSDPGSELGDYQAALCRRIVGELSENPTWNSVLSFADIRILLGGNWDIVLRLFSDEPDAVGRFVTRYLRAQPTIVRTATSWALSESSDDDASRAKVRVESRI